MNRLLSVAIPVLLGMLFHTPSLGAQLYGVPYHASPSTNPEFRVLSGPDYGQEPHQYRWHARAFINVAYVSMSYGIANGGDDNSANGGTVALNLLRGGTRCFSFSVEAGVGQSSTGSGASRVEYLEIPLGIAFALEPDLKGVDFEPWMSLRWHGREVSSVSLTRNYWGPAVTIGTNLRIPIAATEHPLLGLMGLHAALEYKRLSNNNEPTGINEFIASFALSIGVPLGRMPQGGIIK